MDRKTDTGQVGASRVRAPMAARERGRKVSNRPLFHKVLEEALAGQGPVTLHPKAEIERKARDAQIRNVSPGTNAAGLVPLTALLASALTSDAVKTTQQSIKVTSSDAVESPMRQDIRNADARENGKVERKSPMTGVAVIAKAPTLQASISDPGVQANGEDDRISTSPPKNASETTSDRSTQLGQTAGALAANLASNWKAISVNSEARGQLPAAAEQPAMKKLQSETGPPARDIQSAVIVPASRIVEGLAGNGKPSPGEGQNSETARTPQTPAAKPDAAGRSSSASAVAFDAGNGASPARQIAEFVADAVLPPSMPNEIGPTQNSRNGQLQTLELVLSPEAIGRVRISLQLRGRSLELKIEAKSAEAAAAIERDRSLLGRLLSEAGIQLSVADISVEVRTPAREPANREYSATLPGQQADAGDGGGSGRPRDAQSVFPASETRSKSGDNSSLADHAGVSRGGIYI